MLDSEWEVKEGSRPTTDTDARRFAVYVVEAMLAAGETGVQEAPFIERAFFELALRDRLTCEPIPEEERAAEIFPFSYTGKDGKRKVARWENSNVLKLGLERSIYSRTCVNRGTESLYRQKRNELLEGRKEHERSTRSGLEGKRCLPVVGSQEAKTPATVSKRGLALCASKLNAEGIS
jgi:hypothetical protein